MCRTRIIEVENCKECPYLLRTNYCSIEDIEVADIKTISEHCKLKCYPYDYGNSIMQDEYGDY